MITTQPGSTLRLNRFLDVYSGLLDAMPCGILVLGHGERVMLCNPTHARMAGWNAQSIIGKPWLECVEPTAADSELAQHVHRALHQGGESASCQHRLPERAADGGDLILQVHVRPVDFDGARMVLLVTEDITEQLQITEERDRLFAAMFHDLRSPLASAANFAQYLTEDDSLQPKDLVEGLGDLSETCAGLTKTIQRTMDHLHGKGPEGELIDFGSVVRAATKELRHHPESRRVELTMTGRGGDAREGRLPVAQVWADPDGGVRALRNLIDNGYRYAQSKVEIVMEREKGKVTLTVRDDGKGLSPTDVELVFEDGVQGDGALPGTGHGLAQVRHWVQGAGGAVLAKPGPGGHFLIELPLTGS